MTLNIHEFLTSYDKAVSQFNIDAIVQHFNEYFTISTPTHLWPLTNNEAFRMNLNIKMNEYKKLGTEKCEMINKEIINFSSNHYLVHVKWGLMDKDNQLMFDFDISYCIKPINGELKHIFAIDHNQQDRITTN
jgi:hypothetical protein